MFAPHNENILNLAYKSKYNCKRKNKVVLLMITNGKKWHYIVLKSEPTEDGEKSLKAPFVIYADFKCLLLKQQSYQNNPNESYTERKAIHEPSGYALNLVCSFHLTK